MTQSKDISAIRANALFDGDKIREILEELSPETFNKLMAAADVVEANYMHKRGARGLGQLSAIEVIFCLMAGGYI